MIVIAGLLKDFNNAFRFGTKMKKPVKKAELSRALEAVSFAIKAFWTAGIFTFLVPTGSVLIKNSGNLNLSLTISYIAVGLCVGVCNCFAAIKVKAQGAVGCIL